MKVSIAGAIRFNPEDPRPLTQIYDEFIEFAVQAEELGLHRVWLSEHHFTEDGWNPAPMPVLAALSKLTSRIRLGTFLLPVPLHNPLKVAEEVATLDILTHGRFDLGVGEALAPVERAAFGIAQEENMGRLYEALTLIQRFLTEPRVTHHGKFYHFDDVEMTTKPVQRPHPPIFTMPLQDMASWQLSAERGYNVSSALHAPAYTEYGRLLAQHGHSRASVSIATGPVFVHVSDSRERAFDEAERAMRWSLEFYVRRGFPRTLPPLGEFRKPENAHMYGIPILAGSPTDVLEGLAQYKHAPFDDLSLSFAHPGMEHRYALRSLRLFAQHVLPEVRDWNRGADT